MNDPKVFKLGIGNDLRIFYKWYVFLGVERLGLWLTAVWHGMGLNSECLLVKFILVHNKCMLVFTSVFHFSCRSVLLVLAFKWLVAIGSRGLLNCVGPSTSCFWQDTLVRKHYLQCSFTENETLR